MESKPKRRIKQLRPASGRQLFTLNAQGLLRFVDITDELFVPGGPPGGWTRIDHRDAAPLLDRLRAERYAGLLRWPEPGEAFVVRDGLVHSLGKAIEGEL